MVGECCADSLVSIIAVSEYFAPEPQAPWAADDRDRFAAHPGRSHVFVMPIPANVRAAAGWSTPSCASSNMPLLPFNEAVQQLEKAGTIAIIRHGGRRPCTYQIQPEHLWVTPPKINDLGAVTAARSGPRRARVDPAQARGAGKPQSIAL